MELHEETRTKNVIEKIYKLMVKAYRVSALATPVSEILSGLAIVTIIAYGGVQVMEGNSTPGKLFSFITAFLLAYEPMKRLAKLNAIMQMGLAAAERVFSVLDTPPLILDKPDAKVLKTEKPEIVFTDVSFRYQDGTEALRDLSMVVPAGKTVALVGASGAGKSTVLNLIPRFYDVEQGSVKIDGMDVRDVTLESLRAHMALVSQEVSVFNDTVRENIAYGKPDASETEIIEAAKAAAAHDFISELPEGYETKLGEQGVKLSGGQRQRIAIARAMLKNAPVLLLDEATSALDTESERVVQQALDRLQRGRTTIVVAHRLSTIEHADLIYVLEGGKVVEQGSHADLVAQNGVYARLQGGFLSR